jgi:hypothetical protein
MSDYSNATTHQASERLAREVNSTQARSMGKTNGDIFSCLARYGGYFPGQWCWDNTSTTVRAVESFAKRGLVTTSTEERRGKMVTRYTLRADLKARLVELEAEVQAERKARDAAREAEKLAANAHRRFVVIVVDSSGIPVRLGSVFSGLPGEEAARQLAGQHRTTPEADGSTVTVVELATS